MFFLAFKYLSYIIMAVYCAYTIYTLSFLKPVGWEGLAASIVIFYVTVPIFLIAIFWLNYSTQYKDTLGLVLAGLTCAIPTIFILLSIVTQQLDKTSLKQAREIADTTLAQKLLTEPEKINYSFSNYSSFREDGVQMYTFVYSPNPPDYSKATEESFVITVNPKTDEVVRTIKQYR